MFKKLYLGLATGLILLYGAASWFGWEMANSSNKTGRMGTPFFYTGFRGGK